MVLLTWLLLAAAWLVPVFASDGIIPVLHNNGIEHCEMPATGPLIPRAFNPVTGCQDKVQQPARPADDTCIISLVKMDDEDHWGIADDETAHADCMAYCDKVLATAKAEHRTGSSTCIAFNKKPYVDGQGTSKSGSRHRNCNLS